MTMTINEYQSAKDDKLCEHCNKWIPWFEPLVKIHGYDDLVCLKCADEFEMGSPGAGKIDLDATLHSLCVGEQAKRLIEKIVTKK